MTCALHSPSQVVANRVQPSGVHLKSRCLHCRDWNRLNDSAAHPPPAPWYPPSSRPADKAYIVASPPPVSPRKPWEGTLREIPPHQQQLLRGSSPQHAPQQNQSSKPQHAQHTAPFPQEQAACRPSVQPQHSPQSPLPASRYSSTPAGDRVQHVDRSTPEGGTRPRQIDRAISAQEWEGFAVAAQLNGQDEGRSRQSALGPNPQNRRASDAISAQPQYLLLPEAESYDSFMLLAHAFRQWRSHAASEQTMRYAATSGSCALCSPSHDLPGFPVTKCCICLHFEKDVAHERHCCMSGESSKPEAIAPTCFEHLKVSSLGMPLTSGWHSRNYVAYFVTCMYSVPLGSDNICHRGWGLQHGKVVYGLQGQCRKHHGQVAERRRVLGGASAAPHLHRLEGPRRAEAPDSPCTLGVLSAWLGPHLPLVASCCAASAPCKLHCTAAQAATCLPSCIPGKPPYTQSKPFWPRYACWHDTDGLYHPLPVRSCHSYAQLEAA